MICSYTQISRYLACPRGYRHRYLDGWREKNTRANIAFGRVFERALAALFLRQDPGAVLFQEWSTYQNDSIQYSHSDNWEQMLRQGIQLLERLVQDCRIHIQQPRRNMQIKFTRPLWSNHEFVAYVDAIGQLDGKRCLLEWKTSSSRYPEEPQGLVSLDPQLVCYSWVSGISDVAHVVFVRKRLVEVQYLRTTITEEQRIEFGRLIDNTIGQIESGNFLPHSGIRFPQNPCTSCPYIGLCLGRQELIQANLVRRPGDAFGLFDELTY
jgi:PD-(D/E)XK nuclease superfamily